MKHVPLACVAACLLASAGAAHALAPVSPADLVGIGTMSATCSSLRGGGNGASIAEVIGSGFLDSGTQCTGQAIDNGVGSASSASSFANGQASTSATGQASLGTMHLYAALDTPGGAAATSPASISQTAFADTVTVNLNGQQGQNGYLLVGVQVTGALDGFGNAGAARLNVAAMKDNNTLSIANPGFDRGTGNAASTDRQLATWAVASYPVPGPLHDHLDIDQHVVFSIPVTFGTSFEMQLVAMSVSASRNSDGSAHSFSDFAHTITWTGVEGVLFNGAPVNGFTLTSLSGVNWTQAAAVPEPATWLLLAAGTVALRLRGRRSAR